MKTSRYTEALTLAILRQAEGGVPVAERCNRTGGHEWPDQDIFGTIEAPQDHTTQWLWTCINPFHRLQANDCRGMDRLNRGGGAITPARKLEMAA